MLHKHLHTKYRGEKNTTSDNRNRFLAALPDCADIYFHAISSVLKCEFFFCKKMLCELVLRFVLLICILFLNHMVHNKSKQFAVSWWYNRREGKLLHKPLHNHMVQEKNCKLMKNLIPEWRGTQVLCSMVQICFPRLGQRSRRITDEFLG